MGAASSLITTFGPMIVQLGAVLLNKFFTPPSVETPMPNIPDKSPDELKNEARKEMGINFKHYNFGICGNSGTGKSSFINAVRGLGDADPAAAAVGVTECTTKITPYPYLAHPHIVLWDIPGGGTVTHAADTYFMAKKLYAFDMIILLSAGRVTQLDVAIAKSAQQYNVPVIFVRSKSDQDIINESRRLNKRKIDVKEDVKIQVIRDIKKQLPNELKDREIFVISSRVMGPLGYDDDFKPELYKLDEERMIAYILQVAVERRTDWNRVM